MELNVRELRHALSITLSRLRRMSLSDAEELSVSDSDPAFALLVRRDATVELMAPEAYEADPSRAVVVRPFLAGPRALKAALEDAEAILAEDRGVVLRDSAPKASRGSAPARPRKTYTRSAAWYASRGLPVPGVADV